MEDRFFHRGIVENGEIKYFSPSLRKQDLLLFEGQGVTVITELDIEPNSSSQYGFYHAGIIRDSCMKHEDFGGWTESEIDKFFKKMFLTIKIVKELQGELYELDYELKIEKLGMKKMAIFLQKVIDYLISKNIPVRDPDLYLKRKYRGIRL